MAGMQNGPVPTTLTLLSDLCSFPSGAKVRFLGCVSKYSTNTAVLTLEHNHPPNNSVKALVDVRLLLNTLKSNETSIGEWVNVMGYVTSERIQGPPVNPKSEIKIQAIVLWSANSFNLEGYENSLDQKKVDESAP